MLAIFPASLSYHYHIIILQKAKHEGNQSKRKKGRKRITKCFVFFLLMKLKWLVGFGGYFQIFFAIFFQVACFIHFLVCDRQPVIKITTTCVPKVVFKSIMKHDKRRNDKKSVRKKLIIIMITNDGANKD